MKKLLFLIGISLLVSCETKNVKIECTPMQIAGKQISIYVFDSCEYIGWIHNNHGDWATHKGNCKFCIERNKTK